MAWSSRRFDSHSSVPKPACKCAHCLALSSQTRKESVQLTIQRPHLRDMDWAVQSPSGGQRLNDGVQVGVLPAREGNHRRVCTILMPPSLHCRADPLAGCPW